MASPRSILLSQRGEFRRGETWRQGLEKTHLVQTMEEKDVGFMISSSSPTAQDRRSCEKARKPTVIQPP